MRAITVDSLELSSLVYDGTPPDSTLSDLSVIHRDTTMPSLHDSDLEGTPVRSSPRKSRVLHSRRVLDSRRSRFHKRLAFDSSTDTCESVHVQSPSTLKAIKQTVAGALPSTSYILPAPSNTPDTSLGSEVSTPGELRLSQLLGERPPCIGAEADAVDMTIRHTPTSRHTRKHHTVYRRPAPTSEDLGQSMLDFTLGKYYTSEDDFTLGKYPTSDDLDKSMLNFTLGKYPTSEDLDKSMLDFTLGKYYTSEDDFTLGKYPTSEDLDQSMLDFTLGKYYTSEDDFTLCKYPTSEDLDKSMLDFTLGKYYTSEDDFTLGTYPTSENQDQSMPDFTLSTYPVKKSRDLYTTADSDATFFMQAPLAKQPVTYKAKKVTYKAKKSITRRIRKFGKQLHGQVKTLAIL